MTDLTRCSGEIRTRRVAAGGVAQVRGGLFMPNVP